MLWDGGLNEDSDNFGHRNCLYLRDYSAMSSWRALRFNAVYHAVDGIAAKSPPSVSNPVRVAPLSRWLRDVVDFD
jgi:hypothetical protein